MPSGFEPKPRCGPSTSKVEIRLVLCCLLAVSLVTACGEEQGGEASSDTLSASDLFQVELDPCDAPGGVGSWSTVGEPFIRSWCRGCHSRDLPTGSRQSAPLEVNFDKKKDVEGRIDRISARVQAGTMPPAVALQPEEVDDFLRWLSCGAP